MDDLTGRQLGDEVFDVIGETFAGYRLKDLLEQVLAGEVSKEDADPTVARMYLTSDTGKVYTMLAHAAGRLS